MAGKWRRNAIIIAVVRLNGGAITLTWWATLPANNNGGITRRTWWGVEPVETGPEAAEVALPY